MKTPRMEIVEVIGSFKRYLFSYASWVIALCLLISPFSYGDEAKPDETWQSPNNKAYANVYDGLHVLHVFGSSEEMGKQHGEYLKHVMEGSLDHSLHFFLNNYPDMFSNAMPGKSLFLGNLFNSGLNYLSRHQIKNMSPFMREGIQGLHSSLGRHYSLKQIIQGFIYPDKGQLIPGVLFPKSDPTIHCGMGCSTALHRVDEQTLFLGRNFEFDSGERWQGLQSVIHFHPDSGMQYSFFGSLGVHAPGVNGMNEKGVYIALQVLPLDSIYLGKKSTPILAIMEDILRTSNTLTEAENRLKQYVDDGKLANSWLISMAGPRSEGGPVDTHAYEIMPGHMNKRLGKNAQFYTNHPVTEPLNSRWPKLTPTIEMLSIERQKALEEALQKHSDPNMDTLLGKIMFRTYVPDTVNAYGISYKGDDRHVHIVNMPKILKDKKAHRLIIPLPSPGSTPEQLDRVQIKIIESADPNDVRAFSYITEAQSIHAGHRPDDVSSNYLKEALSLYDKDSQPRTWLFGHAILMLEELSYQKLKAKHFNLHAMKILQVLNDALDKTPLRTMPSFNTFYEGQLNPMQRVITLTWIFALEQTTNFTVRNVSLNHLKVAIRELPEESFQLHAKQWLELAESIAKAKPHKRMALLKKRVLDAVFTLKFNDYYMTQSVVNWGLFSRLREFYNASCMN